MTLKHNRVHYWFPIFLIIMFTMSGLSGLFTDPEFGVLGFVGVIASVGFIGLLCYINYTTEYLEIDGGVVKGRKGLIKKTVLSTPIKNISYCELTTFLIFNKIKINAITGHYEFKNMKNAKEFVDMVNNRQA